VSYQCVEGSKWLEIDSQSSGVVSCACSKTGSLVVITFDGDIKLRLNISRDNPTGSSWVIVSQPTLVSNIRQIVIGTYAFWALDNQGGLFFRAGVRTELPQGKVKEFKEHWISICDAYYQLRCIVFLNLWKIYKILRIYFFRFYNF